MPHTPCEKKVRYPSFLAGIDALIERFNHPTHVKRMYQCPKCDGWHMTSKDFWVNVNADPFPSLTGRYRVVRDGQMVYVTLTLPEAEKASQQFPGSYVQSEWTKNAKKRWLT